VLLYIEGEFESIFINETKLLFPLNVPPFL